MGLFSFLFRKKSKAKAERQDEEAVPPQAPPPVAPVAPTARVATIAPVAIPDRAPVGIPDHAPQPIDAVPAEQNPIAAAVEQQSSALADESASVVAEPEPLSAPEFSPEELCEVDPAIMDREEIRTRLAALYRRHNAAAASLDADLRAEAELMLDAIVACREKYIEAP